MTHHTESLTTHEHVRFSDGDHVIVHSSPSGVQVTGMVGGDYIEYAGSVRDAREQAHLLETGAPDALWTLPDVKAGRIATAMLGAGIEVTPDEDDRPLGELAADPSVPSSVILGRLSELTGIPTGDSHRSERVALDDGHADVDVIDKHVEVTVTIGGRVTVGLALSPDEATRIGKALTTAAHRANVIAAADLDLGDVETVTDLFRRSQHTGVPTAALIEHVDHA